jgi:hypothetical protein
MASAPHLVVALSAHGFGHAAQTAPVVNRLRALVPGLRVTLRTALPRSLLATRFDGDWTLTPVIGDFGVHMASSLDVQVDATAAEYAALHADWETAVEDEARALAALQPDLLLANVSYRALAGAARAGIPAVALCSLNWLDIYRHYCGTRPEAPAILAQMRAAYAGAGCFLRPTPGMPMADLPQVRGIGPIARLGQDRRAELRTRLGIGDATRVVLLALGGVAHELDLGAWPQQRDLHWLVPASLHPGRRDMSAFDNLGLGFADLLRSVDAVVGKPGYGTFLEAACNATPLLYVSRGDWPEQPCLTEWVIAHARAAEVSRDRFERGELREALEGLWALPVNPAVSPTGIDEAAQLLAHDWLAAGTRHRDAV